jgi:hypothetical protein
MFINEIDTFIHTQFNKIKNDAEQYKYKKDTEFIQYYNKIIQKIDYTFINQNITNEKNIQKIQNIIEKYILFYLLLIINTNKNDQNDEKFIQILFNLSQSFYILDSSIIGELLDIYKNYYTCTTLIKILQSKKDLPINDNTVEIIQIFNEIGLDVVTKFFDIEKKQNNGVHNILVTFIFKKLYIKTDKKIISEINENTILNNAEYKYITVIDTKIKELDFASMEMLFTIENRKKGIPDDYYTLIQDYQIITLGEIENNLNPEYAIQSNLISNDRKISYLFHKKILIPITDEILRYHVNDEKYITETVTNNKQNYKQNKKVDTKLNYIINKINAITEHANNKISKKLYYQPLYYRQALPYNDIEEMKIIKKFADIGKINNENVSGFTDLLSFRVYPYINFHDYASYGFNHTHSYTTEALRYTNFKFKSSNNKYMQWRIITHDNFHIENKHNFNSNIVGIAFPKYINFLPYDIRCLKINNSVNIHSYNKNGYNVTKELLRKLIMENKVFNKTPYWIFDGNTDIFTQDEYENINDIDKPSFFKKLISKIYDIVEDLTLERILHEYKKYAPLTLYQSKQIWDIITKKLLPIPQYSNKLANINYARYFTYLPQRLNTDDNKENILNSKELIKLPIYTPPKNLKVTVIDINNNNISDDNLIDKYNAKCQHSINLDMIQRIREKDPTLFAKKINDFYKKYIVDKVNNNFICKSCSQFINIEKYITQHGDLLKINAESKIPLNEQLRYSKFSKAIISIDKIIERMGSIFNLTEYMGKTAVAILKRRETTRQLLDILLSSYDLRTQNVAEFDSQFKILEEVVGAKYSEYFAFPVENDIFVYSSQDTDKFKRRKYNTILAHIAVLMLLDISNSNIMYFNIDKLINITIFDKYGLSTLDNLKLKINKGNDLVHLGNYLLLGYVIYYMASMMIRMKVYETENPDVDVRKVIPPIDRIRIMHTIVHILSIIIDRSVKETDYLYTIFANNYFIKLLTVYNTHSSELILKEIRHNSEKKIDNTITKKLVTKKQTYKPINGTYNYKLYESIPNEYKSIFIFRRLFPPKIQKYNFELSSDDINIIIKKNLYWMYKRDTSLIKLNLDISELDTYNLEDLNKIKKKYFDYINNNINEQKRQLFILNIKQTKKYNKLKELSEHLQTNLLPFNELLDIFISKLEKYINENQTIYKENYYLRKSIFIINHDNAGYPITPYTMDKITIKYNDTVTKKDVIIYKEKSAERYYDIYSLAYLGYKTQSTEFVEVKNHQYLIIKYSLIDKIKYMGLYSKYINIVPVEKNIKYQHQYRGDIISNDIELVNNILINKINHDKLLIEKFQRIIYLIRNKKIKQEESTSNLNQFTNEQKLINDFIPRLSNLKILNNDFILFLQNWKKVCTGYSIKPIKEIKIVNNFIDSDVIINNNNYNILIRYLLVQLINLIDMNSDKTNINLCSLIAMIFDLMWTEYEITNNYEINKFLLILYTGVVEYDINLSSGDEATIEKITPEEKEKLPDAEKEKIADAEEDFKEEQDAIDAEPTDQEDLDMGEQDIINYDRDEL